MFSPWNLQKPRRDRHNVTRNLKSLGDLAKVFQLFSSQLETEASSPLLQYSGHQTEMREVVTEQENSSTAPHPWNS